MIRVTVLYPTLTTEDGYFDMDYYKENHAQLIEEKLTDPGFIRFEIDKGIGSRMPGELAPFVAVGHIIFTDKVAFQRLMGEHGRSFKEDVPNFTNIESIFQVSEILD